MLPGDSKIGPKRVQIVKNGPEMHNCKKDSSPSMLARPCRNQKWFLGGPWAPEGGPKNPKRPENTSPKAPQRGPKGAQEGSQDNFDVLTWKNARPSEYTIIYNTKCMSGSQHRSEDHPKSVPESNVLLTCTHIAPENAPRAPQSPTKWPFGAFFCKKK